MPRRVAPTDTPPPVAGADAPEADVPTDIDLRLDEDGERRDDLTNGDLARIFHDIGDMLEVKGELVFKTVAYHRAADAIGRSPVDLVAAYRAGDPPTVPGVGKAISDKIAELATTGRMAYYDKLCAEVPPSLVELVRIPGLGP
jgi:DNA polymerase (family 10)